MTYHTPPRSTVQRRVILDEIRKVDCHPTAAGVYELVRRRLPKISLGTVYRNLEWLTAAGEVRKLAMAGAEARFDADTGDHYHVRCDQCGAVADVRGLRGDSINADTATEVSGYAILGHRLEFVGICPECQAAVAGQPRSDLGKCEPPGGVPPGRSDESL